MSQYDKNKRNVADEFQAADPIVFQYVSYTGTSSQSSTLNANTSMVWLFSTTDCWINFGTDPTAVAGSGGTSFKLRGGIYRAYAVTKQSTKIAVIRDATSGELDIHEGR